MVSLSSLIPPTMHAHFLRYFPTLELLVKTPHTMFTLNVWEKEQSQICDIAVLAKECTEYVTSLNNDSSEFGINDIGLRL